MKTKITFKIAKGIMYAFFTFHFSLSTFNSFSQGIGINTTGNAAKDAALLEVGEGTQESSR